MGYDSKDWRHGRRNDAAVMEPNMKRRRIRDIEDAESVEDIKVWSRYGSIAESYKAYLSK